MAKTIDNMVVSAKEYANLTGYTNVSDATWFEWVNRGIGELWDALQEARGAEYFTKTSTIALVSGTEDYALPADFGYLVSAKVSSGGVQYEMKKFEFADEHILRNITSHVHSMRYHIVGSDDFETDLSTIKILPNPQGSETVSIRYVRTSPMLSTGQSFGVINGWEEYAELIAAIKALDKLDKDTGRLEKQLARVGKRIMRMRSQRDGKSPPRIKDVRQDWAGNWLRRNDWNY